MTATTQLSYIPEKVPWHSPYGRIQILDLSGPPPGWVRKRAYLRGVRKTYGKPIWTAYWETCDDVTDAFTFTVNEKTAKYFRKFMHQPFALEILRP